IKLKDGVHPDWEKALPNESQLVHVKVKEEIEKIIASGIIKVVEELEWISLM
ncbi:hypothetical protein KI387_018871, partial [Taxus chinensis]